MRLFACLAVLTASSFTGALHAQQGETAGDAFAVGTAAFAVEDYLLALSSFQSARDAGMEGPAIHYNIGVSHYRLGQLGQAKAEFLVIAERYPAMRELAEYNLGLVAERQGDADAAETHFRWALKNAGDEKIRRLAGLKLSATSVANESSWYRWFNVRLGHDDNVRLLSDDVAVPAGESAGSNSTELMALVSGPIRAAPGFRYDASLYAVSYQDASFFDQKFLSLSLSYQWRWGQWLAEVGPHLSYSTLDGDGYEDRAGAEFRARRELAGLGTVGVRYALDDISEGAARFAFVDGSRDFLELRYDRRNDQGRVTLRYALESSDRSSVIASTRTTATLRYQRELDRRWTASIEGSFRSSEYDDAAPPRDEDLKRLSFGLTRNLGRGWALAVAFSTADNDTVAPYSYSRTQTSVAIGKTLY